MSNNLSCNPVIIDTFHSDVTIFDGPGVIRSVVFQGTTTGDRLVLEDKFGNWKVNLLSASNSGCVVFTPTNPIHTYGLIMDVSDGVYAKTASAVTLAMIQI